MILNTKLATANLSPHLPYVYDYEMHKLWFSIN